LEKHFGSAQGVTNLFPYMKADFNVKGNKNVFDPRVMLKTNNEYHGLERHARQYHVVGMYDVAAEHWLLAAAWRRDVMRAEHTKDDQHVRAMEFAIQNYRYNRALYRWQKRRRFPMPEPEHFGLSSEMMDRKDQHAEAEIERGMKKETTKCD
jgi:hypothetical protein